MDDNRIKHLEFIQNIINRMNNNSFQIKTFTITIMSALLAIYASNKNEIFIIIGLIPTTLFWILDTYYLQQERKFRGVYNNISGLKKDMEIKNFEMPIHKFIGGNYNYFNVFRSKTMLFFYGLIILLLISIYCLIKYKMEIVL